MAQVTVELRNLLRTDFELFDFEYEFDDKKMAAELEQAVIDHYSNYEIGQEVPDDFKRVFKNKWLSATSYYNRLHNTTLLEYNPLINYKMNEALEKLSEASRTQDTLSDSEGTNKTTGTTAEDIESSSNDRTEQNGSTRNTRTDNLKNTSITDEQTSDYPQQAIAGGDFLSGARQSDTSGTNTGTVQDSGSNDNTTTSDATGTSNTTRNDEQNTTTTNNQTSKLTGKDSSNESYEKTLEGITGTTYQDLINKERGNILRIRNMLIEELKPCFILVY